MSFKNFNGKERGDSTFGTESRNAIYGIQNCCQKSFAAVDVTLSPSSRSIPVQCLCTLQGRS